MNDYTCGLEKGDFVLGHPLDFPKAFNTVITYILHKTVILWRVRVSPATVSYLSDRTQYIDNNHVYSIKPKTESLVTDPDSKRKNRLRLEWNSILNYFSIATLYQGLYFLGIRKLSGAHTISQSQNSWTVFPYLFVAKGLHCQSGYDAILPP